MAKSLVFLRIPPIIKRGPAGTRTPNQRIMSPSNLRINMPSKILAANKLCIYLYLRLNYLCPVGDKFFEVGSEVINTQIGS